MSSSFNVFLQEGLIKLPEKLKSECVKFFIEKYLAYLKGKAPTYVDDAVDMAILESMLNKLAHHYHVKFPDKTEARQAARVKYSFKKIPFSEIPAAYLDRLKVLHGKKKGPALVSGKEIKLTIVFANKYPGVDDELGSFDVSRNNELVLMMGRIGLLADQVSDLLLGMNVKRLQAKIEKAIGFIEHELTHAVQFIILKHFHSDQIDFGGGGEVQAFSSEDEKQKYYTSQVEFDPHLKSEHRKLLSVLAARKHADPRLVTRKFVWGDRSDEELVDDDVGYRSDFFRALKKSSPVKWKKAVKLLTTDML